MIDISTELKDAFKAYNREIHAEVTLNFSDITIDPSVLASSLEAVAPDLTAQVTLGNTVSNCKWASLDGISDMSGDYCMQPSDVNDKIHQVGFWSDAITDASGVIDTTFSITSSARRISKIDIYGDNSRQEYPVNITLIFYDSGGVLSTEYITGNTGITINYDLITELVDVIKVDINITKYSTPLTNVKILGALTSLTKTFTGSDIISFTTTEEAEISNSNTIPTGNVSYSSCSLNLVNKNRQFDINNISSPLYGAIRPSTKMDIKLGARTTNGVELFPFFSGWTGAFDAPDNSMEVSTTAYDRIERLRLTNMTPTAVQIGQTVEAIATLILNDAGIATQFIDIDTRLSETQYILPIYYISGSDHLSELRRLSEAVTASVYSVSDVIHMDSIEALSFNVETQESYGLSDYSDKTNTALYDTLINTMKVNYAPFSLGSLTEQYSTPSGDPDIVLANSNTILTFLFSDKVCVDHALTFTPPSGVTIVTQDYYSDRAVIEFNNTNLSNTNITLSIDAKNYGQDFGKTYSITDVDSQQNYGDSQFLYPDNELIQTLGLADTLGDYLLGAYKDPFRDVTVQLNNAGNPALSLTDKIAVVDRYTEKRYNIINKETSFDGGLSMVFKARIATLKDFNLVDNFGNNIVDNLGNQIIVLNTDIDDTYDITDNIGNTLINNNGFTIVARS